ncbi:hypothetical protein EDB92DRAFT_1847561 [Lactarius akahatsu]|uniref:Uncharacterized protein n=1 Tax=Lactarius akahatsu TaxID=416441 RepID=A0AAD4QFE2_9AGAM|nr:hypothetical protein EDB92DRAFT_1847561 [Lactarius akahatsu]
MATSDVVKETLNVAGLSTNVYTRANLRDKPTSGPVVVLFFLHGRTESADHIDPIARAAFSWAAEKEASSREAPRDFIVVTFDQRNHGKRMVDQRGNFGWGKNADQHNERQAYYHAHAFANAQHCANLKDWTRSPLSRHPLCPKKLHHVQ